MFGPITLLWFTTAAVYFSGHAYRQNRYDLWAAFELVQDATKRAWEAVERGDAAELEKQLAQGAKLDPTRAADEVTIQISKSHARTAILLLDAGADVAANPNGAIFDAIEHEYFELALRLLQKGAKPKTKAGSSSN